MPTRSSAASASCRRPWWRARWRPAIDRHHHGQRQPRVRARQHLPGRGRRHDGGPHQRHRHRHACRHDPALFAPGAPSRSYTILSAAGGRTGTFAARQRARLSRGAQGQAELHGHRRVADVVAGIGQASGLNRNQRAVATGIERRRQRRRRRSAPASSRCSTCPRAAMPRRAVAALRRGRAGAPCRHATDELVPRLVAQSVRRARNSAGFGLGDG